MQYSSAEGTRGSVHHATIGLRKLRRLTAACRDEKNVVLRKPVAQRVNKITRQHVSLGIYSIYPTMCARYTQVIIFGVHTLQKNSVSIYNSL